MKIKYLFPIVTKLDDQEDEWSVMSCVAIGLQEKKLVAGFHKT